MHLLYAGTEVSRRVLPIDGAMVFTPRVASACTLKARLRFSSPYILQVEDFTFGRQSGPSSQNADPLARCTARRKVSCNDWGHLCIWLASRPALT